MSGGRPMVQFEWDPAKAAANLKKHGISFADASQAFGDQLSLTIADPDSPEQRLVLIGQLPGGRLLVVVHALRGTVIRLISARPATRHERKSYEQT